MKAWHSALIISLALMGLNGCTPTRVSDRVPPLIVPERWQNAPDTQPASAPRDLSQWWKGFGDPMLNDLIDQALATNHDLRLAKARVREAKAMVTVAESALYPSLDVYTQQLRHAQAVGCVRRLRRRRRVGSLRLERHVSGWVSAFVMPPSPASCAVARLEARRSRACRWSRGRRPSGCDSEAKDRRAELPRLHPGAVGDPLTRTQPRRVRRLQRP